MGGPMLGAGTTISRRLLVYYKITITSKLQHYYSTIISSIKMTQMLVKKRKDDMYPQVYLLVKFALLLSVATAIVEMTFLAMNIVKNELRNQMRDE